MLKTLTETNLLCQNSIDFKNSLFRLLQKNANIRVPTPLNRIVYTVHKHKNNNTYRKTIQYIPHSTQNLKLLYEIVI